MSINQVDLISLQQSMQTYTEAQFNTESEVITAPPATLAEEAAQAIDQLKLLGPIAKEVKLFEISEDRPDLFRAIAAVAFCSEKVGDMDSLYNDALHYLSIKRGRAASFREWRASTTTRNKKHREFHMKFTCKKLGIDMDSRKWKTQTFTNTGFPMMTVKKAIQKAVDKMSRTKFDNSPVKMHEAIKYPFERMYKVVTGWDESGPIPIYTLSVQVKDSMLTKYMSWQGEIRPIMDVAKEYGISGRDMVNTMRALQPLAGGDDRRLTIKEYEDAILSGRFDEKDDYIDEHDVRSHTNLEEQEYDWYAQAINIMRDASSLEDWNDSLHYKDQEVVEGVENMMEVVADSFGERHYTDLEHSRIMSSARDEALEDATI